MLQIKRFKELNKEILDVIINKHYSHWSKYSPTMSLENTIDKFRNIYAVNDEIPFGIAMFDNDNLIGFCVFKVECLKKYPEFSPWISDVMIFDKFRNKGYGKKLINEALKTLSSLGYNKAYLWTDQAPDFYKKLGFSFLQIVEKNEGGFGELYIKEIE